LQRYLGSDDPEREELFREIHRTLLPGGLTARVLRGSGFSCGPAMLDFLDWAHATDADDPDLLELVEECAARLPRRDEIWADLAQLLGTATIAEAPRSSAPFRRLVAARPDVRWPRRLLAESLVREELLADAARTYATMEHGAPYECSPGIEAGVLWHRLERLDQARPTLIDGIVDTPDCIAGHRQLAIVERALGNSEAAALEERIVELLEAQEGIGPGADTARYRLALGDAARRSGRVLESRYHYRRGLENEPESEELQRRLQVLGGGL
jgi:predicted Zn-dependent protease